MKFQIKLVVFYKHVVFTVHDNECLDFRSNSMMCVIFNIDVSDQTPWFVDVKNHTVINQKSKHLFVFCSSTIPNTLTNDDNITHD